MKRTWGRYWPIWVFLASPAFLFVSRSLFGAVLASGVGLLAWSCGAMMFEAWKESNGKVLAMLADSEGEEEGDM